MTNNNDMSYLDKVIKGYVECATWSDLMDDNNPDELGSEPYEYTVGDVDGRSLNLVRARCGIFMGGNLHLMRQYVEEISKDGRYGDPFEQFGHDLWLTTRGHGVGFWDRDLGALGNHLTAACKKMGEPELPWLDKGWVRFD